MDADERFVANMRLARELAGWSQAEFSGRLKSAGLTQMHQNTVSRIEKGERPIRMAESQAIAEVFGLKVDEMLREDFGYFAQWIQATGAMTASTEKLREAVTDFVHSQAFVLGHLDGIREAVGVERSEELQNFATAPVQEIARQLLARISFPFPDGPMAEYVRAVVSRDKDRTVVERDGEHPEAP